MSATLLLDQTVARLRAQFTHAEVVTVQPYGGEFSATEIPFKSYACPAIFVTVLGWSPAGSACRVTGRYTQKVRMAAFIAFKHAERNKRMAGAMLLAERLAVGMRQWAPALDAANTADDAPVTIGGLEEDASCENLYSRTLDGAGQALWLVDWHQCVRPNVPPEQLYELLHLEIVDTAQAGGEAEPAALAVPTPMTVTEAIIFPTN